MITDLLLLSVTTLTNAAANPEPATLGAPL